MMKVSKTQYHSWKAGSLPEGCKRCVKGEKLVLFITGLCSQRCEFCPVSDRKLYKDVIYANERPIDPKAGDESVAKAIIEEAAACSATGAGITGGDPLVRLDRTVKAIRLLKKRFGKSFHIHLYTPLRLVSEQSLKNLFDAGLDEIRFHPRIGGRISGPSESKREWRRVGLAKRYSWAVGVEIPALPGKEEETRELISFLKGRIDFLNINELELADNEVWRREQERDSSLRTKDGFSYAIKGSEELAKRLLQYSSGLGIRTHYCTCTLKDRVQLAKRVLRRAKNIRLQTDIMDKEGMLTRGAVYLPSLKPGFGYRKKLSSLNPLEKQKILKKLGSIRDCIARENSLQKGLLFIDKDKLRIVTSSAIVRRIRLMAGFERAIVTEYPTFDALELEVEFLR
ncbi:radical SAM protein [Candidatus Woesearchaeota archaeon]|nr:radical SAM protein [Candidatus Woesearchaeota archaeon]